MHANFNKLVLGLAAALALLLSAKCTAAAESALAEQVKIDLLAAGRFWR